MSGLVQAHHAGRVAHLQDGDYVGDVYRQPDILHEGEHYYVVWLDEDFRGPVRVHERERIREVAEQRVRSHPLWG